VAISIISAVVTLTASAGRRLPLDSPALCSPLPREQKNSRYSGGTARRISGQPALSAWAASEHADQVAGLTHAGEQGQIQLRCALPLITVPFIGQHPHSAAVLNGHGPPGGIARTLGMANGAGRAPQRNPEISSDSMRCIRRVTGPLQ